MAMADQMDFVQLGSPVPDTHAHLDMLDDPAGALERAAMADVQLVATVVDLTEAPAAGLEALPNWPNEAARRFVQWEIEAIEPPLVRVILGAHPHNAKLYGDETHERLLELSLNHHVGAIGEMGLDFHYDHSPREDQRKVFVRQMQVAKDRGLAAVIHLRDAHEEGLALLDEMGIPEQGAIIHCFSEGPEMAERFLELGCYISFAGTVTFDNADGIREAARIVPLERLLVETDSPFLAPVPHRGKRNEPAFVTYVAKTIAEVKGVREPFVAKAALENAARIFGSP